MLDDVWDASVVEAFETIGLSLLVTTREVRPVRGDTIASRFKSSVIL